MFSKLIMIRMTPYHVHTKETDTRTHLQAAVTLFIATFPLTTGLLATKTPVYHSCMGRSSPYKSKHNLDVSIFPQKKQGESDRPSTTTEKHELRKPTKQRRAHRETLSHPILDHTKMIYVHDHGGRL